MAGIDYAIIALFMAFLFWAGSVFYRWVGDPDDFYLAGRQLTPFILAATITATNVNLYSFVGQAGVAYEHGISIIWQTWTGNMALVFAGLFVIPILRRLRVRTIPEFLEMRYNSVVRYMVGFLWIFRLSFWLGVVLYTAVIAAQTITGFESFTFWVILFSIITIIYTMLGGMWSVALTDSLQFVFMLAGALIVLPLVMSAVGWWPGLVEKLPALHLELVPKTGDYNWKFVLAIWIIGIQWACVDQGLLQRAFGGVNTKAVAKGLVLAGIVTTPFALLWNIPGLAAQVIKPGLENADQAIPYILSTYLPPVVLGFVFCGLLAAQMSTISSNLNAVATMFTNDIYGRIFNRQASKQDILKTARIMTIFTGIFMMGFTYLVPVLGGAVDAYLTIVSIMDMPLFVVAIFYGLLWKRTTWQGAVAGYLAGALAGGLARFGAGLDNNTSTFFSAGAALLICPIVTWITSGVNSEKVGKIWAMKSASEEEKGLSVVYNIIPQSIGGRIFLFTLFGGLALFLTGIFISAMDWPHAGYYCVAGMVIYFLSGLARLKFD
ncbi:sodium:solute symporter family protein [candidate division KSB1 bacterium]|nr:sodium:solute symporter family protein [candidate division KSB1 bacterium]